MAENVRSRKRVPTAPSEPSKPCFQFKEHGTCKFGQRCKYSHKFGGRQGNNTLGARSPVGGSGGTTRSQHGRDGKLQEWKRLLGQSSRPIRPSPSIVARFFQLGLELMDGDIGAAQEAIKLLVSEPGLSLIKDVSDRHILQNGVGNTTGTGLWDTEVKPLFQLITHSRVIDSAVLEQEVAAIFNFLLGVGGGRMTRLFSYILQLIQSWPASSATNLLRITTIELSLSVLSKILDCNTTNIVNNSFSRLVTQFSELLNVSWKPEVEFSRSQALRYLDYIQRRLEIGDEIPTFQNPTHSVARESFILRRDLPGHMSADGARHDNDHVKISDIKILPTYREIMSPRGEYLPTNDPSQWHVQGIRGRLDREFRLVREDTIGQLRDAVRETLESIRNPNDGNSRRTKNGARTYTYDFPTPVDVEFDKRAGLELVLRCNQPSAVQSLSSKKRRDWWIQCKRLQAGALVCILDVTGSVLFCVVSDSTMRHTDDKKARPTTGPNTDLEGNTEAPKDLTLSDDPAYLYCKLQLAHTSQSDAKDALRWYRSGGLSLRRYLVEFPGVLLASFKDTLAALQQMYEKPNIPFTNLVAPSENPLQEDIDPPQYSRKDGFAFDLTCLVHDGTQLTMSPQRPLAPEELASRSTLDLTQSAALLNTLSRELALIQGPPGTGKSYTGEKIIKVLLHNKTKARLGPILCVCYTNHALDQLLEHLLDEGIRDIIRIGSRSKSERLQDLNLRALVQRFDRTKSEKSALFHIEEEIGEVIRQTKDLLRELAVAESWRAIKNFLAETYPKQHDELFGKDEDGWEMVIHQPEKIIGQWLMGGIQSEARIRRLHALEEAQLLSMTRAERRIIHRHWLKSMRDEIISRILKLYAQYNKAIEHRNRVRTDVDLRCLRQADVVGVTTTGLARNMDLLRKLNCKVMLCEEAGEVLEAHILTALLPTVEHAILIGDHLQLRPQIQNYELQSTNPRGEQYSLDLSLFERLVQPPHTTDPRLPFTTLETQRRMDPSIAELIRSTLYPSLKDAEKVMSYPKVFGMKKRLFWLQHENLEAAAASNDPLSTSHSNDFEVEMTTALVSHIIRQGEYSQGDVAVITPYLGQLHKLRRRMESMFEISLGDRDLDDLEALAVDSLETPSPPRPPINKTTLLKSVRVATVDNFQGEEAKVIVISLVRSNPQNKCGFLSTSNRINVLLSRAQHGMYIIGNSNMCKNVPMWADVLGLLQMRDQFGTELELQCPRHPDTPLLVSQPDHFLQFSPESGCNRPCDQRLYCGHPCIGRCHSNALHSAVKCLEDCPRSKKGCDHPCPRRCGDPCQDKCYFQLRDLRLILPCDHQLSSAKCWEAQDPTSIRCMVQVTRTVTGCNHQVKVSCYEKVTATKYRCPSICGYALPCGHSCTSLCSQCNTRENGKVTKQNHGVCKMACGRKYSTCPHSCSKTCHSGTKCPPCNQPCEVRCGHSKCSKLCHEPCAPCAEKKCHSSCPHTQCMMPCAAPCDWVPCHRRCPKILSCGHQCPSLCGETCPASLYCQQCGSDDIKSSCVDFLEMKEYREIDLDEEPCIFPDCGHFLTVSSMDGQMDMAAHYDLDDNGLPVNVRGLSEPFSMDKSGIRVCATCRGSLRSISRYGRIVRRAMLDEATKKFIAWSQARYIGLANRLLVEQEILEKTPATSITQPYRPEGVITRPGSRPRQLQTLQEAAGKSRYAPIIKVWHAINSYAKQVQKEEQPFQRVADLVKHANLQRKTKQEFRYDEALIQVKGCLLAMTLLLKCEIIILSDFVQLRKRATANQMEIKLDLSTHLRDCASLIELANKTVHPREAAQGHIIAAQLCGFSRSLGLPSPSETSDDVIAEESNRLKETGLSHVAQARELVEKYQSTASLKDEIDAAESMLNGSIYRPVTTDEVRAVYEAMTGEFRGTGHWYTCQNGHPFTIGECGMPMERARCPECNSLIGGQNHQQVEGTRHATEIEEIARGVAGL